MEHLNLEALARLVDEQPTGAEREHLATCETCVAELDMLREQTLSLGSLPDVRPPKGDWAVLEARMVSEGLVQNRQGFFGLARTPDWMKAAAAVMIFVGGTGMGMGIARSPGIADTANFRAVTPASFASTSYASVEDAAAAVRLAERQYVDALVQYQQLTSEQNPASGRMDSEYKLAALESLISASQAAVQQFPADAFLNGHLASLQAERQTVREMTLRQAGRSSNWW